MKKGLLLTLCAVAVATVSSVQALELKTPNVSSLKSVTTTKATTSATATKTNTQTSTAKTAEFKKTFEATIKTQTTNLTNAQKDSLSAIEGIAKILEPEVYSDYTTKKAEINANKELSATDKATQVKDLNKELVTNLNTSLSKEIKKKNFAKYEEQVKTDAYKANVIKLKNSRVDCENIVNNMSPSFNKILKGEISALDVKSQLVESGKLSKNVKMTSMGQTSLLRSINKIDLKNNVVINPTKQVVFCEDGIVGGINTQLKKTNVKVNNSADSMIKAFNLGEEVNKIKAELEQEQKDALLSNDSKTKALTPKQIDSKAKAEAIEKLSKTQTELSASQSKTVNDAYTTLTEGLAEYTALGIQCTKLGFSISSNPLLAAPLILEVDQLKYTASMLKDSAGALKNTISAVKTLKSLNK